MKLLLSITLLLTSWMCYAADKTSTKVSTVIKDNAVGFDQVILFSASDRPLKTSIWYPSETTFPKKRVADNPAFVGTDVVRIGTPLTGHYPLVIISHGYRGNWRNQNWLATKLAMQGFVVASVDHPGTTSFDRSPQKAAQWWKRPQDLSRLLDWMLKESSLKTVINTKEISAIGHSLGGWTVMALAGAQFDRDQLKQECVLKPNPRVCGLTSELGLDQAQKGEPSISLKDDRIKQVVSLDLGLARSFSRQSLKQLSTKTLILAAGIDIGDLPQEEESGFIAKYTPKTISNYKVYADAAHFSFMQLCKPGAIEMLEEEMPGDSIVCKDGNERLRKELHQVIYQDILAFIL